jgi:hypothetical protein
VSKLNIHKKSEYIENGQKYKKQKLMCSNAFSLMDVKNDIHKKSEYIKNE